ncbi:hypothetical protein PENSPDRAFT_691093 [Peniophora sp. CONT]|nr:hypothetical protein PENSPDRAFT_691093 [Peniophora sp. CONT]
MDSGLPDDVLEGSLPVSRGMVDLLSCTENVKASLKLLEHRVQVLEGGHAYVSTCARAGGEGQQKIMDGLRAFRESSAGRAASHDGSSGLSQSQIISKLKTRLGQSEKSRALLHRRLDELQAQYECLLRATSSDSSSGRRFRLLELRRDIACAEREVVLLQDEVLRSEHEAIRSEHEALRSEHEALRSEHEALRSELETAKASSSRLGAELCEVRDVATFA